MKFKLTTPDDDGDGNKVTLPIHEFGKMVGNTYSTDGQIDEVTKSIAESDAASFKRVMENIKDVHWIKEPEVLEGPITDALRRYRTVGWHGLMASQGYVELRQHFESELACRKEHMPKTVTLKFIARLAKEWFERVLNEGEQPKRCDCEDCDE